jgi:hypothetical protein
LWHEKDGQDRPFLFGIKGLFGIFDGLRDTARPTCAPHVRGSNP